MYDKIPIDWGKVCRNLRQHESLAEIMRKIGCREQLLCRLERGDTYEP